METIEKNLLLLEKTNKILCEKIKNTTKINNIFELKTNLAGEYNLSINGKLVHSVNGAETEAKKLFDQLPKDTANTIHVVYGLGLGYLPDYYFENSKGYVVVYEPNIETLRVVMEIVDFEKLLSSDKVFFAASPEELKMAFDMFFKYKTETDVSCLDYYKFNDKNAFSLFMNEFRTIHNIYAFNHKFHVTTAYNFLVSTLNRLYYRLFLPEIDEYKDILKNKPAIIVSAGPSLAKNIESLKKVKDYAVIFCVGAAYKTLYENGITPDFAVLIEKIDTSIHYTFPNNKDVNMIIEPFTNPRVFDAKFKRYITSVSYETASNHWFEKIKNKKIGNFEAKGTVSYQALSAAKFMGCNPLILLGQDLAYVDGKCYAKGSQFEDLECTKDEKTGEYKIWPKNYEKFKSAYYAKQKGKYSEEFLDEAIKRNLDKILKGLVLVDDQKGGKLPTQSGYAMFIEYFKDFAKKNRNENILINASTDGANIKGFENKNLIDAMKPYMLERINIENCISKVNANIISIQTAEKNLNKEKNDLQPVIKYLEQGQSLVKIIKLEHERHKKSTQIGLNSFKKAIELYSQITSQYFANNGLYRLISTNENSEMAWFIKEGTDITKFEVQQTALEIFKNYFFNVEQKCKKITRYIELNLERLDESSTAKS